MRCGLKRTQNLRPREKCIAVMVMRGQVYVQQAGVRVTHVPCRSILCNMFVSRPEESRRAVVPISSTH